MVQNREQCIIIFLDRTTQMHDWSLASILKEVRNHDARDWKDKCLAMESSRVAEIRSNERAKVLAPSLYEPVKYTLR